MHIVLTGGSETCCDSDAYFDYVIDKLPKKDVSASWDRLAEGLHSKDKTNLFARLPDHVSDTSHLLAFRGLLHPCCTAAPVGARLICLVRDGFIDGNTGVVTMTRFRHDDSAKR